MANRPNKRVRQARAKAVRIATNERNARTASAEAIPAVRTNVSSWYRVPKFDGVGYQSGFDPASFCLKEIERLQPKQVPLLKEGYTPSKPLGTKRGSAHWREKARLREIERKKQGFVK